MPYKSKIKKPKPKRTDLNVGKRKIPWIYIIYGVLVVAGVVVIGIGAATATGPAETPVAETPSDATTDTTGDETTDENVDYTGGITELQVIDDVVGTGAEAVAGSEVNVQYTGSLYTTGTVFDSTANRDNEPFTFTLGAGSVIQGWDQGILGMKVGGTRTLIIPASLGYGETGTTGIPSNATLKFEVTLESITEE
jgi:FKBP-type peptidyl-prolyl cis-trans isomerase FkpA